MRLGRKAGEDLNRKVFWENFTHAPPPRPRPGASTPTPIGRESEGQWEGFLNLTCNKYEYVKRGCWRKPGRMKNLELQMSDSKPL